MHLYVKLIINSCGLILEWALCQRGALSHLQANSCVVQYKIVLGGNQQNQTQAGDKDRDRFKKDTPVQ
jgi:DnaJ family protein C protein 14